MVHKENVCASQYRRLQLKGMFFFCFWACGEGGDVLKVPCYHIVFVGCVSVVVFSCFSFFFLLFLFGTITEGLTVVQH